MNFNIYLDDETGQQLNNAGRARKRAPVASSRYFAITSPRRRRSMGSTSSIFGIKRAQAALAARQKAGS